MIYPKMKHIKTVLYTAISAPIVLKIAEELGVEVPDEVKTAVNIGSPIVAAGAGILYGHKREVNNLTALGGTNNYNFFEYNELGKPEKFKIVCHDVNIAWPVAPEVAPIKG